MDYVLVFKPVFYHADDFSVLRLSAIMWAFFLCLTGMQQDCLSTG